MSVDALLAAKDAIEQALSERAGQLRQQIARLTGSSDTRSVKARRDALKGTKVAPKYRGPNGELWAGRGAHPVWLREQIKKGRKIDSFLIDRPAKKATAKKATAKKAKKAKRAYTRRAKASEAASAGQHGTTDA
jgi:DNA-binding protein H-NS